ncbi:homocysteine biosynthesis protein [Pseudodesulfovibrio sp.]|uniref:homocysteine biosynthesis protein n=1 Tax=Pseudodesulfovibrio sp. TaxID=2035812 RepID=UPI00260A28F7|nr:homocysteine biosynthesis protein [Pseudodesulfovibrio sp.]MDD3310496.1 homocysteine biosynthesis protein [Pseudodesulfovibrio sp.]
MAQFQVNKTIAEINERIRKGKAVVVNAEEMIRIVQKEGKVRAAQEVDVVTTGTFSPMCSSGVLFNIGQQPPVMKVSKLWLNNVPCYCGIAAVDAYVGATEPSEDDPLNKVHPGRFAYGGGHVIEDLLRGKAVHLRATAFGTDCYPRRELDKDITLADLPNAWMLNPRNCYQNYNAAVNLTSRTIYTYMGPLKSNCANCNFATAGQLSPLFNDPYFRTIGLGTRIFLGGGIGYVIGEGTQHVQKPKRNERGLPVNPAGTLMLKGDLKQMDAHYVRGQSLTGYGPSLAVGVGIPIPMLNEEMAWFTAVSDADITMPVKDYGYDYPNGIPRELARVTFEQLRSGEIEVNGKKTSTVPVTSYSMSLEIADKLKKWIENGKFLLTEKVENIPSF